MKKLMNTFSIVFMLVMNTLAVTLPIGGKTTGELSDNYPNLFVPAGFTFAIWSIIYLLLITFVVNQWITKKENSQIEAVGPFFLLNGLLNGSWILAWHYEYIWLSLLIMGGLLYTLIMLYNRLKINYKNQKQMKWLVHIPISVYLGWISVASIANVTTLLVSMEWAGGPLSQDIWASLMIGIAILLGFLMLIKYRDIFYVTVIGWAVYGICSKRSAIDVANMPDVTTEQVAKYGFFVMVIGVAVTIILSLFYKNKKVAQ